MEQIILASTSPRRQEILKILGVPFRVIRPEFEEKTETPMTPEKTAAFFAYRKMMSVIPEADGSGQPFSGVLGADTLVSLDGRIYGKPSSREEAALFLETFSGRTHQVISALAFSDGKGAPDVRTCVTDVTFASLSGTEITEYLDTREWNGAAGGYRIQEKGSCLVSRISGSFSCVVGLPIFDFYEILNAHGFSVLK